MKTGSPNDRQPGIQHSLFYQFFFLVGTTRKEFSRSITRSRFKGINGYHLVNKIAKKMALEMLHHRLPMKSLKLLLSPIKTMSNNRPFYSHLPAYIKNTESPQKQLRKTLFLQKPTCFNDPNPVSHIMKYFYSSDFPFFFFFLFLQGDLNVENKNHPG